MGALQETLYHLPILRNIKHRKLPFWFGNSVRVLLFAVFAYFFVLWLAAQSSFVPYHHLNLFKLFSLDLARFALFLLPVVLIVSLLTYRPYCLFICPFGLWAWLWENLSLQRVRIRPTECIHCNACVLACPTTAMHDRMHTGRHWFLTDCWACGACVEKCPTEAAVFETRRQDAVPSLALSEWPEEKPRA